VKREDEERRKMMVDKLDDLVKKFRALDTTSISDALDRLGIKGGCQGILPQVAGTKAVGRAFTVRYRPCGVEKGTVGDFLDDVEPGQVVVLDNGGRTYGTVWGDIMTVYAKKRGIAGTIIDGVCRDLPRILELKYPIFTRGRLMVTGKDRVEVDGINIPVAISDVQVRPRDIVVADDTGVVIVPFDKTEEVLKVALEIDETEQKILELLEKGMTLREARQQMGYHKLQSRK
jgi:regulator of RNase E activity RraA